MHILFVVEDIPTPGAHGAGILCWGIIKTLLESNHRVTVFSTYLYGSEYANQRITLLRKEGVEVLIADSSTKPKRTWARRLFVSIRSLIYPTFDDFYPESEFFGNEIGQRIDTINPDILLTFDFPAIAAARTITNIPCFALVGTWSHWFRYYAWRYRPHPLTIRHIKKTVRTFRKMREPQYMIKLLNSVQACGHLAANHANWFRENGVPGCDYYPSPLTDPLEGRTATVRRSNNKKPIIGMMGQMGTPMYLATHTLIRDVLPKLEVLLGMDGFEIHFIGDIKVPDEFKTRLNKPYIKMLGYVKDLEPILTNLDIFLVPTPEEISIRLRILTALSYGCLVVTTRGDARAIPELIHGENALIADRTSDLANLIVSAIKDPSDKIIRKNARNTFLEHFFYTKAGGEIERKLVELAN